MLMVSISLYNASHPNDFYNLELLRTREKRLAKKIYYKQKLDFYKTVLSRIEGIQFSPLSNALSLSIFTSTQCYLGTIFPNSLNTPELTQKKALAKELIEWASCLEISFDERSERIFSKFEQQILPYLDDYDNLNVSISINETPVCLSFHAVYKEATLLSSVKKQISILLRKIYHKTIRDIRNHIRCIIRYIFICVDDEGDLAIDFTFSRKNQFAMQSSYYYETIGKKEYSRLFKYAQG